MTALFLTTQLPGLPVRQRAVVTTAVPGLYLTRRRGECDHDAEDYDPRDCPACQPWAWEIVTACGLTIGQPWAWGDALTLRQATALAADLGRTGIDWTAVDVLTVFDQLTADRMDAIAAAMRTHNVWVPADHAAAFARARDYYAAAAGAR